MILSLGLKVQDKKYDQAMAQAAEQIQHLNDSLFQIGFERDAVKTTDFDVDTEYENVKDGFGNYTKVFRGCPRRNGDGKADVSPQYCLPALRDPCHRIL